MTLTPEKLAKMRKLANMHSLHGQTVLSLVAEIERLRDRVDGIKASIRDEMLPKVQAMSNWIGKHWANRDWGCEAEKLHESMGLLDDIAKCVGLDISTGTRVRRLGKQQQETEQ